METNPINDEVRAIRADLGPEVIDLTDRRLRRITRLRLVTDPGYPYWDLSYCYGDLEDGTHVRVRLPQWQFSRKNLKGDLIQMCKQNGGLYAKGLGLLDDSVLSLLY